MAAPITGYTELDLIGFTDKGNFDPNATYFKNDLLSHSGIKWRVLTDNLTGVTPTEGANYTVYMRAVESFNGRSGSILPIAGDYDANIVMLASAMHIGGETQTNVEEALNAIVENPSGHNILNSSAIPMAGLPNLQFGSQYDKVKVEDDTSDPTKPRNIVHAQIWVCDSESDWKTMTDVQFLAKYGANRDDDDIHWYLPWATAEVYAFDRLPVGTVVSVTGDSTRISGNEYPTKDYLICKSDLRVNVSEYPQLAQYFADAYGSTYYFDNASGLNPGDGKFKIPDFTADYPTNGVLCIKARLTANVVEVNNVDETGLSSRTDEVPNCARIAAIEANADEYIKVQFANTSAYTLAAGTATAVYLSTTTPLTGYELVGITGYEISTLLNITVSRIELDSAQFIRIINSSSSPQTVAAGTHVVKAIYKKKYS